MRRRAARRRRARGPPRAATFARAVAEEERDGVGVIRLHPADRAGAVRVARGAARPSAAAARPPRYGTVPPRSAGETVADRRRVDARAEANSARIARQSRPGSPAAARRAEVDVERRVGREQRGAAASSRSRARRAAALGRQLRSFLSLHGCAAVAIGGLTSGLRVCSALGWFAWLCELGNCAARLQRCAALCGAMKAQQESLVVASSSLRRRP